MRGVGSGRDMADKELIAQKYNHIVLNGKLRAAVKKYARRYLCLTF